MTKEEIDNFLKEKTHFDYKLIGQDGSPRRNFLIGLITQAISKYEASQLKEYPKNKPVTSGEYLVQVKTSKGIQYELLIYDNGWWGRPDEMIIAFINSPQPSRKERREKNE